MERRTLYPQEEFKNNRDYNIHWWNLSYTYYHRHCDFYELILTNKPLLHLVEGVEFSVPEHTLLLIPPMVYHRLLDKSRTSTVNHFNLSVKTDFLNMIAGNHSLNNIFKTNLVPTVHLADEEYAYFLFLAEKSICYINDEELCKKYLSSYITAALSTFDTDLYQRHAYGKALHAESLKDKLDNFEFLNKSISDFYKIYPVQPAELISDFKKLTGTTIVQYIVQKRIQFACNLLVNTHLSLEQITEKIGYNSVSHFIRVFKSIKKMTPSKYRNSRQ